MTMPISSRVSCLPGQFLLTQRHALRNLISGLPLKEGILLLHLNLEGSTF